MNSFHKNFKSFYFWIGLVCMTISFIAFISANNLPFTGNKHYSLYYGQEVVLEILAIFSLLFLPPLLKILKVNSDLLFAKTVFVIGLYNAIAMVTLRIPPSFVILVGLLIYALMALPFILLKFTFKIGWIKTIIIGICNLILTCALLAIIIITVLIFGAVPAGWR